MLTTAPESRCTYLAFGEPECAKVSAGMAQMGLRGSKRHFCAEHMATVAKNNADYAPDEGLIDFLEGIRLRSKELWPLQDALGYAFWAGFEYAIQKLRERC